jgi:uroporphyrinogen decarboxylase
MWFPRFEYCLRPILEQTSCRMLWHCDGDVRPMVPGLIECGVVGFQGFQYEYGVDFAELCKFHSRDGSPLSMYAGVSVTRTLPYGTPEQVRKDLDYLVEVHGDTALMLGATSSVLPGVPSANIDALIEGLAYYRTHRK